MTLREILIYHANKYPEMTPSDAVKLIYQNEFGPGHLVRNGKIAFSYLEAEYSRVQDSDCDLLEHIGNGIVRVNLSEFKKRSLDLNALFDSFCRSAESVKGSVGSFEQKLKVLTKLAEEGVFKFSVSELCDYLSDYKDAGYPMVSHSEVYKQHYHPSYRIVTEHLFNTYFKEEE